VVCFRPLHAPAEAGTDAELTEPAQERFWSQLTEHLRSVLPLTLHKKRRFNPCDDDVSGAFAMKHLLEYPNVLISPIPGHLLYEKAKTTFELLRPIYRALSAGNNNDIIFEVYCPVTER